MEDRDVYANIYVFPCVISISICDFRQECNRSKIYVLDRERMMICIGLWGRIGQVTLGGGWGRGGRMRVSRHIYVHRGIRMYYFHIYV